MYVSVLVLEPVEKPLSKEEIDELKYTEDQLSKLKNYIPNIFNSFKEESYETSILYNPYSICKTYNENILELVLKANNMNHIYRVKENAGDYFKKTKSKETRQKPGKTTLKNLRKKYNLIQSLIEEYGMYIIENDTFYPFGEWISDSAQEGKKYQVIQIFKMHI